MSSTESLDTISTDYSASETSAEKKDRSIFHEQMITFLCSVYGQFVIVIFVAADIASIISRLNGNNKTQFEWLYTYIYLMGIIFLAYVFLFVRNERGSQEGVVDSCKLLYRVYNNHSHSSLFFLSGIFMFGLASIIYSGISIAKNIQMLLISRCAGMVNSGVLTNQVLNLIYIFLLMYFIFSNYRKNFVTGKTLMKFGLTHIISTNICMFMGALMRETLSAIKAVEKEKAYLDSEINGSAEDSVEDLGNSTMSVCELEHLSKIEYKISHYLLPAVIEFGILSSFVLFSMKSKIGHIPKVPKIPSQHRLRPFDMIGSRKGFFCGLLVFVMALVNIVMFLMIGKDYDSYQMEIPHICILILCIVSTFIGFFRIQSLKIVFKGPDHEVSGNILLRISLCGAYLLYMLMVVAGFLSQYSPGMILTTLVGILNIVQLTQQIFFMYDITYRTLDIPEGQENKLLRKGEESRPGRNTVSFLCVCNFTLWIIYTFQAEKYSLNPVTKNIYGSLAWAFMVRTALPLMIFFRFHSIDVIGKIWHDVYSSDEHNEDPESHHDYKHIHRLCFLTVEPMLSSLKMEIEDKPHHAELQVSTSLPAVSKSK